MLLACAVVVVLSGASGAPKADTPDGTGDVAILPQAVVLRGQGSHQQLIVESRAGTTYTGNRTGSSSFVSSNPNVATVDAAGVVAAVSDGRAIITARDGEVSASTVVEVERASAPYPLTFRNHVMPVLTRAGCNSGPCHGSLSGKNGF